MNKIAKASIAGAAGVILLMGGAGSLAYWNNSQTLGGTSTTITAGQLKLTSKSDAAWSNSFNGGTASAVANVAGFKVVPGDKLTYSESFDVAATGDNLKFKVETTAPSYTGTLASYLAAGTVTVTAYDGASTPAVVTPNGSGTYTVAQGVKTLKVSVPFTWAFGTVAPTTNTSGDNAAQGATGTLANYGVVTLTQVAS